MENWYRGEFLISTNKELLNLQVIHQFLSEHAYWSKGIPKEIVNKSIENTALCFGVYIENSSGSYKQLGFARVVTDKATFAYLCDVFILPDYRRLGLSKWLMEIITTHLELQDVRRFMLATNDAHTLYKKFGFEHIENPETLLQIRKKNPYQLINDEG